MKRLYRVDLTIYVAAEDGQEARDVAHGSLGMVEFDWFDIEQANGVLIEWYGAIPFGADNDETCIDIIKRCRKEQEALDAAIMQIGMDCD